MENKTCYECNLSMNIREFNLDQDDSCRLCDIIYYRTLYKKQFDVFRYMYYNWEAQHIERERTNYGKTKISE